MSVNTMLRKVVEKEKNLLRLILKEHPDFSTDNIVAVGFTRRASNDTDFNNIRSNIGMMYFRAGYTVGKSTENLVQELRGHNWNLNANKIQRNLALFATAYGPEFLENRSQLGILNRNYLEPNFVPIKPQGKDMAIVYSMQSLPQYLYKPQIKIPKSCFAINI